MTDADLSGALRLERADRRWRALFAGHLIADTPEAWILHRGDLAPAVFFPRRDVSMEYMSRTDHRQAAPHLGEGVSYTLLMDGHWAEHAVLAFEHPEEAFDVLADCLAFDTSKIEVYSVDEAVVHSHAHEDRSAIDEAVQHTDSGAGFSQRGHWPPNVSAADG
ncbi:MAG: DUF427 domain-containing protein [Phenylobacterium sp.]